MSWVFLVIVGAMILSVVRSAWKNRKPEAMTMPIRSHRSQRAGALVIIGLGILLLIFYAQDPADFSSLAFSLFVVATGVAMILYPSYRQLNDRQRELLAREKAKTWWVAPAHIGIFLVGFVALLLLAPRWAMFAFGAAWICVLTIWIAWSSLRMRKVLREEND